MPSRFRGRIPRVLTALCTMLWLSAATACDGAPPPELSARSALIMDGWTGDVLYEKNARSPQPIASLTKIMTAVVVLEKADLSAVVRVPKLAAEARESTCHLKEGELLTVGQLLKMALMRSGNDAAVALALHVSGSIEGFAAAMNEKAAELGLTSSRFTNPHGLEEKGHYQSALDLANLTRYAMEDPRFAAIVALPEETIPREGYEGGYRIDNTNHLLKTRSDCIGVKTGWTGAAGYCLISAVQRGGRRFIAVVMHSAERFAESNALLDWALETYVERVVATSGVPVAEATIRGGEARGVPIASGETVVACMQADAPLPALTLRQTVFEAPIAAGRQIGVLEFQRGDQVISVPAVAVVTVRRSFASSVLAWPGLGILGVAGATAWAAVTLGWSSHLQRSRRRRRSYRAALSAG